MTDHSESKQNGPLKRQDSKHDYDLEDDDAFSLPHSTRSGGSNTTPAAANMRRVSDMVNKKLTWLNLNSEAEIRVSPRTAEWMDNEVMIDEELETARLEKIVDKRTSHSISIFIIVVTTCYLISFT